RSSDLAASAAMSFGSRSDGFTVALPLKYPTDASNFADAESARERVSVADSATARTDCRNRATSAGCVAATLVCWAGSLRTSYSSGVGASMYVQEPSRQP